MSAPNHRADPLVRAARTARERRRRGLEEGRESFARGLARLGMFGWMIVAPILAGLFAGRWLDRQLGTGIAASALLLGLGAFVGWWFVWRQLRRD